MPFDQIQCADLNDWTGDRDAPGWRKALASIGDLVGAPAGTPLRGPSADPSPAGGPVHDRPSLALVPFTNLSGDAAQDHVVKSVAEEVAAALSRAKSIFVVVAGNASPATPREAARALRARYLLEGSVRTSGNQARVTAKLGDAITGDQVWTERFDGRLDDVFELQDRVALGVAAAVEPNLLMAEITRVTRHPPESPTAYELYLRALEVSFSATQGHLSKALDLLQGALALDPRHPHVLAMAAITHGQLASLSAGLDRDTHADPARALARQALRQAPNDALVHALCAEALGHAGEGPTAVRALLDRALTLNPACWLAWLESGFFYAGRGELEAAAEHLERELALDPLTLTRAPALVWLGVVRFAQGRTDEALACLVESNSCTQAIP